MSKKIKRMIYVACVLWIAVFVQIVVTKVAVGQGDVTQAFARNQLVVEESSTKCKEICREGGWIMGKISGTLTTEECRKIANNIFGYEGGSLTSEHVDSDYYVAYGFTNGINLTKKVNGKIINMNIAITYDENEDKSIVYFGVPFINRDF